MQTLFLFFLSGTVLAILFVILILLGNIVANFYTGVPYAPTPKKVLEKILKTLKIQPRDKIIDLGCGDGRLLFLAEKYGACAFGYELSPFSYLRASLKKIIKKSSAKIYFKNFFSAELHEADIVFCFLRNTIMPRLEKKLLSELRPGARVISYGFEFPNWKCDRVLEPDELKNSFQTRVYFYTR